MDDCTEFDETEYELRFQDEINAISEIENRPNVSRKRGPDRTNPDITSSSVTEFIPALDKQLEIVRSPLRKRTCQELSNIASDSNENVTRTSTLSSGIKVLRRIPEGNYISITTSNQTRFYLKLNPESNIPWFKRLDGRSYSGVRNLLSCSYDDLRLQIEQEREVKLLQEIANAEIASSTHSSNISVDSGCLTGSELMSELWVEKFKPSSYLELLSDDGTNRNFLRWLKLWDKVVFGREVKRLAKETPDSTKLSNSGNTQSKLKIKKGANSEVAKDLDEWNRPVQKVALLCGPPGLGKTTLAHIISKQAGYNPVEMNASDDRSPEAFRNQIEAATQMRAVIGTNPLPNCLIIDEIDGAPSSSINLLVSILCGKPQESNGERNASKQKRLKRQGLLLRPIICICNDQYVPALRPLRSVALVLNFPPTLPCRLASRLLEIARQERLRVDTSTLLVLCEKAENDIRSCLCTLQFVHGRGKELRLSDVHSMTVGKKDVQKGLFSVWQDVFRVPDSKQRFSNSEVVGNSATLMHRFSIVLQLVQSFGDYEKINQGLFENYLKMKYKDHRLNKASCGIDWLCFYDVVNQEVSRTQNYSFIPYLPFTSVAFHFLFATNSHAKIQFPSQHFDFTAKLTKSVHILDALVSEMSPITRSFINSSILVLDLLPILLDIICPTMRQVNTQLYSSQEKAQLEHLIHVMITYCLVYKQECGNDGQYTYVLDHPIDTVASFPSTTSRMQLNYTTKQMVSREIEIEKLRKRERAHDKDVNTINPQTSKVPNHLQKLKSKDIVVAEKPTKDFFGRIILCKHATTTAAKRHANVLGQGKIWYHFKEGYSNAVRKNVLIQDLL